MREQVARLLAYAALVPAFWAVLSAGQLTMSLLGGGDDPRRLATETAVCASASLILAAPWLSQRSRIHS